MQQVQLSILYEDHLYNGPELEQRISLLSDNPDNDIIAVDANKRFRLCLTLIKALVQQYCVFPAGQNLSRAEICSVVQKIQQFKLKDDASAGYNQVMVLAVASSGSQADARIVLLNRDNIISHCRAFGQRIALAKQSVWLNCMPMNHIAGIMILYRCWFNQATLLLHDGFEVGKIWQDLKHHQVSHISLVPIMLSRLLDYCQNHPPPESLKYVIVGGDKISADLYQRAINAGWPVYISYGMTEASSTIALGRSPEYLQVLNGFDTQLSKGGVLKIRGDMVFSAYAEDSIRRSSDSWFETSDRVSLNGDSIKVIGRNDHMLICGGKNIAPEMIEQKLLMAPPINDIAIGPYQGATSDWGDCIAALVCGDMDAFVNWLEVNIEPAYRPRYLYKTAQIPRNSLGKINRQAVLSLLKKNAKE